MAAIRSRTRLLRGLALVGVLAVVAATVTWMLVRDARDTRFTAYFTAAVGIYPGSDVRVLGVAVGTVKSVEPQGKQVRVTMSVDNDVPLPADVSALVVTPSLVSDRYVQLAPVYTEGPRLADHAVVPADRTAVPVELDELFTSLDKLTTALGPDGANADGALNELLDSGAATLDGNGKQLGDMVRELGKAAHTLTGSQDDLFSTVDSIQKFTTMLAEHDRQLRVFNDQLAGVSQFLAGEREDFAAALAELASALGTVQGFIQDNRARIKSNVDKLAGTTRLLVEQQASLSEALDRAPGALTNLLGAYDPARGSIDVRANLNEFSLVPPPPLPATGGAR
ncbi:MAG TPA: MCE family protein [Actinophytocola sp.]|uniref:MCE family protein n=1 Tax=Actinophytocola sp. TaxID=1872138 RepID=UPI002DBE3176|nr:MCE family protein [Actinophytocola sp.]HEU5470297.1 MCE family protein [Actinophytocola sp.]